MERTCADGLVVVSMTRNLAALPAGDGRLPSVEGHHHTATGSRASVPAMNIEQTEDAPDPAVVEADKDF
jgi:hypothetical protein